VQWLNPLLFAGGRHFGGPAMPFVRITIVRETLADDPKGKKAAISAKIAAAISEATKLPQHEISIVFDEVAAANWYVGTSDVESMRFPGAKGQELGG